MRHPIWHNDGYVEPHGSYYESPHWWIAHYYRGKEIRESSQSEIEAEAKRLLKRKVTAIEAGKVMPARTESRSMI
jgi:hypothetical protein